ncbi:MEIKN protein, partial [Rhinopomastus cyanomelas]|nr:MEIKN protein [Rhinopomastus cyanomelas]
MTPPTGVSTFLLECLDVDTTVDYDASAGSSLSSVPSPETFRDDGSEQSHFYPEDFGKYKNSTLLDSSKAVAIDKLPQISNVSAIVGPVMKDFQDQCSGRKKSAAGNYNSPALSVSTTLAGGKKICKITAATERTPTLKAGLRCPSPLEAERKPDNQTAKPKKLKLRLKENPHLSKQDPSSPRRLMPRRKENHDPSEEGPSSPKRLMPRRKENPDPSEEEICAIVRTSPTKKPPRFPRYPPKSFRLPEGAIEDDITNMKNWTFCKR